MIELPKKMIANIEILHAMNKDEILKKYEKIYENVNTEDFQEDTLKLEMSYLLYATMYGSKPCEITKDSIFDCFQHLKKTMPLNKKMKNMLNEEANDDTKTMDERNQEILAEWKKITGDDTPPNIDQENLDFFCRMYRQENGSNPPDEVKDKIRFLIERIVMDQKISEYKKLNVAA